MADTEEMNRLWKEMVDTLKVFALAQAGHAKTPVGAAAVFVAVIEQSVAKIKDEDPELAEKIMFCMRLAFKPEDKE